MVNDLADESYLILVLAVMVSPFDPPSFLFDLTEMLLHTTSVRKVTDAEGVPVPCNLGYYLQVHWEFSH